MEDTHHICVNSTGRIRTVDDTHHIRINSTGCIRTVDDTKHDCKSSTGKITKSQIQLHKQGTFNYWNVSYDNSCLWPTLSHFGMDVPHIIHIYTDQFHLILRTNPLPLSLQPQQKKNIKKKPRLMPPQNIHLFSDTRCMRKQHTFSKTCTHLESQKHTTVEKGVVISRSSSFMLLPLLDDSGVLSLVCSLCPPCSAVTGVRGRLLPSSASDSSRAKLKKSKLAGSRWDPG